MNRERRPYEHNFKILSGANKCVNSMSGVCIMGTEYEITITVDAVNEKQAVTRAASILTERTAEYEIGAKQ
jgi:hypothetical protein